MAISAQARIEGTIGRLVRENAELGYTADALAEELAKARVEIVNLKGSIEQLDAELAKLRTPAAAPPDEEALATPLRERHPAPPAAE